MKEFDIKITEKLEEVITVRADSREEAEKMVQQSWKNSEYVLGSENFVGVEFKTEGEREIKQDKMNVLLVEPGEYPKQIEIGTHYKDWQAVIGGPVEATYPFEDDEVGILLNEEGKLTGQQLNRAMRKEDGEVYDIYAGPFLVVGLTEEDFGSLSPELMQKYEDYFHQPEMFVRMGKGLMVLPIPDELTKPKDSTKTLEPKVKKSHEQSEL